MLKEIEDQSFKGSNSSLIQSLVFKPESHFYTAWRALIVLLAFIEFICYPFIAAFGVPDAYYANVILILNSINILFVIDMALNIIKAKRLDDYQYEMDPNNLFLIYISGNFGYDLFISLPWGFFAYLSPKLICFNLIKFMRLQLILEFLSPSFMNQRIRKYFEMKHINMVKDLLEAEKIVY